MSNCWEWTQITITKWFQFDSFGWPTSQTTTTSAIGTSTTHLANQYYQICIRRGDDYCYICYDRYNAPAPNPEGFGLR